MKYLDLAIKRMTPLMILMLLVLFFSPKRANAYLDPGTGSFFIQMAIAVIVGISFSIKIYWNKIKFQFLNLSDKIFKRKHNGE